MNFLEITNSHLLVAYTYFIAKFPMKNNISMTFLILIAHQETNNATKIRDMTTHSIHHQTANL